jgi:hypothetical protein
MSGIQSFSLATVRNEGLDITKSAQAEPALLLALPNQGRVLFRMTSTPIPGDSHIASTICLTPDYSASTV